MRGYPPHACRPANCQPDLMLLGKSEVCNHFNFIPLLLSSKKLFLAIGKKKSYTISHTLAFQSHMFQENHLLFLISFQTTWLQTWPSYIFWKLCPWESNFHLKKRDMYFQNDGTGLRITVKLPLFCFMVIHVLHIFIQFSNLAINSWKKYFLIFFSKYINWILIQLKTPFLHIPRKRYKVEINMVAWVTIKEYYQKWGKSRPVWFHL